MAQLSKLFFYLLLPSFSLVAMDEPPKHKVPIFEETSQSNANNQEFRFKTDGASVNQKGVNINGGEDTRVYNVNHAVFMGQHLRSKEETIDGAKKFAREEGECKAEEQAAYQKHSLKYATSDEVKQQKIKALKASLEIERDIRDFELREAKSDAGLNRLDNEIELTARKQQLLFDATARQKLDPRNIENTQAVAHNNAITEASAAVAAKLWIRANDPDQTFRGRVSLMLKEAAVRLTVETMVETARQTIMPTLKAKAYQIYLGLPFRHCRELREQEEMFFNFKQLQLKEQMLRKEKEEVQASLQRDAIVLAKEEENIKYFKTKLLEIVDEKEKQEMKEIIEILEHQHIQNRLKYAALVKLNVNQQPYFSRLQAIETARQQPQATA